MKNKINSAQYGNEPFSPKWPEYRMPKMSCYPRFSVAL